MPRGNPRFAAFAQANGRSTQEQIAHDWGDTGDRGADFMAWIATSLRRWANEVDHPRQVLDSFAPLSTREQEQFTRWLWRRVRT